MRFSSDDSCVPKDVCMWSLSLQTMYAHPFFYCYSYGHPMATIVPWSSLNESSLMEVISFASFPSSWYNLEFPIPRTRNCNNLLERKFQMILPKEKSSKRGPFPMRVSNSTVSVFFEMKNVCQEETLCWLHVGCIETSAILSIYVFSSCNSFALGNGDNSRTSQIFISYGQSNALGTQKWVRPTPDMTMPSYCC